jgi:hypothetical protein
MVKHPYTPHYQTLIRSTGYEHVLQHVSYKTAIFLTHMIKSDNFRTNLHPSL